MAKPTALLVGGGKMGSALLSGWRAGGCLDRVIVVEPNPRGIAERWAELTLVADAALIPTDFMPSVLVFAVKPQLMDEVAPLYRRFLGPQSMVLSIAAGKSIATFEGYFGADAAIVRAMPNLPAAVGRGITAAIGNPRVGEAARAISTQLLAAVGEVEWVSDERLLDAVTAVSGSGPAYVFLLIEAMTRAGIKAGLPEDLAARLARATVCGAGELARVSVEDAATLRRNVTSPRGTTAAALNILMAEGGMQDLFDRAIAAAAQRSRDLAS